ncbi:hypothetical protein J9303_14785 [Bacillaceae bacterium Marseille-Q3522]|nr:hypothetical protein [Bacillaceae bacterium Marseille-Q3522]
MELIDRYIYAMSQKLPVKQREDIEKEVRGLIEDMLQERTQEREASCEDIEGVLSELGNPSELADQYRGYSRYLIGPEWIDAYWMILKVVLLSSGFGISISFFIQFFVDPQNVTELFVNYIVSLIQGTITVFVIVTILFGIAENSRLNKADLIKKNKKEWNPADLPPIPDPKKNIKISEPITGIIFSFLIMMMFIYSGNLIGVFMLDNTQWNVIPVFNPETIHKYLPLLYVIVGIEILKECMKLISRKWTKQLAIYNLIINVVSFVLIAIIFSNPSLWNPEFMQALVDVGGLSNSSETYQIVNSIWNFVTHGLIYLLAIGYIVDTIMVFFKAFRKSDLLGLSGKCWY